MIIDQLPEIGSVQSTDEMPVERGQTTYKTPISKIFASPTLTGTPKAPTAGVSTDNTQIATTAFANRAANNAVSTFVRPNLLDNWYFVKGGGTIGDYGVFPVNQRGFETYNSTGFTVDRWAINAPATVTLLAGGAKIQYNSTIQRWVFWQYINCASLVGKTITISRKIVGRQGSNINTVFQFLDSGGSGAGITTIPGSGTESFVTYTTVVPSNAARIRVGIFASTGVASGDYVTLEAIKMELGSTQTLAHQENGAWVLNEIPDYATELAKCQAYYWQTPFYVAPGFITNSSTKYYLAITPPVPFAKTPTVTFNTYVVRTISGYSAHTGGSPGVAPTSLIIDWANENYGITIADTIAQSAGDQNNTPIIAEVRGLKMTAE